MLDLTNQDNQILLHVALASLVKSMGGSVVFDYNEIIPVYESIRNNKMDLEIMQIDTPVWKLHMKLVEREQGNL